MMDIVTLVMACSLFQDYSITHAMIQVGSKDNYLMVTPASGSPTIFPTEKQAAGFITQQLQQNNAVDIGLTQLPSRWLNTYQVTPAGVINPCKNVVIATEIISQMWEKCGHIVSDPSSADQVQACALSMFKTGDPKAGLDYARQVMHYADANPFEKIAAPAMARWEKNAKVPKSPMTMPAKSSNNASATQSKLEQPSATDDAALADTDNDLTAFPNND